MAGFLSPRSLLSAILCSVGPFSYLSLRYKKPGVCVGRGGLIFDERTSLLFSANSTGGNSGVFFQTSKLTMFKSCCPSSWAVKKWSHVTLCSASPGYSLKPSKISNNFVFWSLYIYPSTSTIEQIFSGMNTLSNQSPSAVFLFFPCTLNTPSIIILKKPILKVKYF